MPRITDISIRQGSLADWLSAQSLASGNPILNAGEPAWETDTKKLRVGDGTTLYGDLPYEGSLSPTFSGTIMATDGHFIFNDNGGNFDFRVEGDTDENLLSVDASADRVGIGILVPQAKLDVRGSLLANDVVTLGSGSIPLPRRPIEILNHANIDQLSIRLRQSAQGNWVSGYSFPTVAGLSGQALLANSSGVVGWSSVALGSGISNYVPKWIDSTTLTSGLIYDDGSNIGIGTGSPSARLNVEGGNIVFNDLGDNFDFRVEGDTDQNLLFVDASTDRVGIGTSSPSSKLHVNGPITVAAGSAGAPSFTFADDSDIGVYRAGVNSLAFSTSGVERIRIGPDGEVGIGMTGSSTIGLRILHDANANNIVGSVLNVQMPASALTSYGYWTAPSLLSENTAYTTHIHYIANPISSIPSGSSAGTEVGFQFGNSIQQHTVRGFASFLNTLTGYERYAFLAGGTAPSLFNGVVLFANGSNSAPSIAFSADTDTGLFYPTANNLAITTGGTERLRIDSSGKILVGTTTSRTAGPAVHPAFQFEGTNAGSASFQCIAGSAQAAVCPQILLARHRGVVGASNIVASGDSIGLIRFNGGDDTDCVSTAAQIECIIDGTPGSNDMPGSLIFSTTPDGSAVSTERMRITSAGNVGVGTNSPTERLDINSDAIRIRTAQTPASATAAGNTGDICWDSNYLYVCVATNTWKRSALSTWP